jgi:rRNA maturation protein Nop10
MINIMDEMLNTVPDTTVCHECGNYFTPSGLRMHAGSEKCRLTKIATPMRMSTEKEYTRRRMTGKHPVLTNVALAIKRRNLEDMCGLELAPTKLLHSDISCAILDQYWVNEWVYRIWQKYNKNGYTRQAYVILENLKGMPTKDRDSEIGLILLDMYG